MDKILEFTLLIVRVLVPHIKDLCIIEKFLVEAEDLLVLAVQGSRHLDSRKGVQSRLDQEKAEWSKVRKEGESPG